MAPTGRERRVDDECWSRVSEVIAEGLGLHFPRERWPDLERGLAAAAAESGFDDLSSYIDRLLSAPPTRAQLRELANHLTIGETYFFRDRKTFDVLADSILPALIHQRRGREQRLRLWSAACSSGEEAYSLAILVHQLLPDLADWRVTILATDVNARALQKGRAGTYGEWSFRGVPDGFKDRYFDATEDGRRYTIRPAIKKMVTFEHVNLVDDIYPSLATDTNAMDIVFCRNVLMYFRPAQIRAVVEKLHHALVDGGYLAVSPSEASRELFPQFAAVNHPGVILYQKRAAHAAAPAARAAVTPAAPFAPLAAPRPRPALARPEAPRPEATRPARYGTARSLYDQGRYEEAAGVLLEAPAHTLDREAFSLLARALANQGRLGEALAWCDRWIAVDKVDPAGHYLRAAVLLEHGPEQEARRSLQRAVYLEPGFVLAHFALGNLSRSGGREQEALKHFANTRQLLAGLPADAVLPESDGLTAGRLTEIVAAMTAEGAA